ncbi:translation initiation factor IF-2-like [Coturnix japonica]|uniref:translation initiation factor IF-2-like n=1 Tax=Coturnix japonica TaxID=93934 RepID=UPI0013A5CC0B|nr:translation initiation factor IF-2-like [Coturnix japonica]
MAPDMEVPLPGHRNFPAAGRGGPTVPHTRDNGGRAGAAPRGREGPRTNESPLPPCPRLAGGRRSAAARRRGRKAERVGRAAHPPPPGPSPRAPPSPSPPSRTDLGQKGAAAARRSAVASSLPARSAVQAAAAAGWRSAGIRRQRPLLPERPATPALGGEGGAAGRLPRAASCRPAHGDGGCRRVSARHSLAAAGATTISRLGGGRSRRRRNPRPPHPQPPRRAFRAASGSEESLPRRCWQPEPRRRARLGLLLPLPLRRAELGLLPRLRGAGPGRRGAAGSRRFAGGTSTSRGPISAVGARFPRDPSAGPRARSGGGRGGLRAMGTAAWARNHRGRGWAGDS